MKEESREMMRFWKAQWEAYMQAMIAMQGLGETMLHMIQRTEVLQEGSQHLIMEWERKYKSIQKIYLDMVEEHFKKLEDIVERAVPDLKPADISPF